MGVLLNQRHAGVLLHITSLPSRNMGADAYYFVDFLHDIGASVWQVLPLGITHDDGSPYQSLSAHAGNPELICFKSLVKQGWLGVDDFCSDCNSRSIFHHVCLLSKAFSGFKDHATATEKADFDEFCRANHYWLDDFALFTVLREKFNQKSWHDWSDEYKNRHIEAINDMRFLLKFAINSVKFEQFVFFKQWTALKKYANERGIFLFGDIPIFVSYDSADVWANRDVFKLNDGGEMLVVAGVPPDYFSQTGQRWGNPHYDWHYLHASQFDWWLQRIQTQVKLFDVIRIDHFRGLESAWEIPASELTAIQGEWVLAAGDELLSAIYAKFPKMALVAEDLGIITPEVEALRTKFGLPGMKIMQFAFSGEADNPYLPANHEENGVVYTGTHDNDTTAGWEQKLTVNERMFICETLHIERNANITHALMRCVLNSVANLAILPMQDILELDSSNRMNIPGTTEGNWNWNFQWEQLSNEHADRLKGWIKDSNRLR